VSGIAGEKHLGFGPRDFNVDAEPVVAALHGVTFEVGRESGAAREGEGEEGHEQGRDEFHGAILVSNE
jgi:hypothetical protein